jgi:hypothetical protein
MSFRGFPGKTMEIRGKYMSFFNQARPVQKRLASLVIRRVVTFGYRLVRPRDAGAAGR